MPLNFLPQSTYPSDDSQKLSQQQHVWALFYLNTKQKENQVKQNYWVHFYVDNSRKPIKVTIFYVGTLKTQKKLSKESKYY